MKKLILLVVLILPIFANSFDILSIKKEFKKIESNLSNYSQRKISQEMQEITIYKNNKNRVKKISVEGGSEDSYHKAQYYFKNNRLFFSFLVSNDVHGCGVEVRNYFKNRKIVKRIVKDGKKCARRAGYPAYIKSYKDLMD